MNVTCSQCKHPVDIPRRLYRAWKTQVKLPFVCARCQRDGKIGKAVLKSDIVKAETITRTFQTIHLDPAIYEKQSHRQHSRRHES